jgi:hypothetical protein
MEVQILNWGSLLAIVGAVLTAGKLLQQHKSTRSRLARLEAQVRDLELWQQRERGRREHTMRRGSISQSF